MRQKKKVLLLTLILCLCSALCGCGAEEARQSTVLKPGGGTLGGDILPCIKVGEQYYHWSGMSTNLSGQQAADRAYYDKKRGLCSYLPMGFEEAGELRHVWLDEPVEDFDIAADFEVTGTVYINSEEPDVVIAKLFTPTMDGQYVAFRIDEEDGEQQTENWDYTAYLVYNGEKYRNTDGNTENLPEGYELLGATHETEIWDAWDGEELWATFAGEVYGKDGMLSLYATIPWEDRYIEFVPENIWSATEADYSEITRGMYYFRDSAGQAGEYLWVFCGNGYDGKQQRIFDDYGETLQTGGVLPLSDEGQFDYINGYYDSEDALCLITLGWGDVVVYIYPPETDFWASRYDVVPGDCTKTEINGVTIYGDGAAEGEQKALILTLEDGTSCFIVGTDFAAPEPMAAIAEHFAWNGVDLSAFSIEKGDYYQASSGLDAEASSFVSDCIPEDFNALGLESDVERKNGQINRVVFRVELGIGKHITWTVYPRRQDIEDTLFLGDITSLTSEMAQEAWGTKNGAAGFLCGDKYIWIKAGSRDDLADDIWELISQLI